MSDRPPEGNQSDTINRNSPFLQTSFDLKRQDKFVTGLGIDFTHYKAVPSPIGQNDRGDYRRNDGVDTITSNGFIYLCSGKFTASISDNSRSRFKGELSNLDPTQSKLILPRFYNKSGVADGKRIYLAPGDRLYMSDPNADVMVSNYQKMDYVPSADNVPMFPIVEMEALIDSQNIPYQVNIDYCVTSQGSIRWIAGGRNPGIDPETGKGRIYSIRYLYRAFWYVVSLPKEIRITNVTTGNQRSPERMPYAAVIVREYVYHNQNKGGPGNQLKSKDPQRAGQAPVDEINPSENAITVDMAAISDEE